MVEIIEEQGLEKSTDFSEVFVDTLDRAGIKQISGIVGDSLNGITNALQKNKNIKWVHVRHEEASCFCP